MAKRRDKVVLVLEADEPLTRVESIDMVPDLDDMKFDTTIHDTHRFLVIFGDRHTMCHNRFKEYFASKY